MHDREDQDRVVLNCIDEAVWVTPHQRSSDAWVNRRPGEWMRHNSVNCRNDLCREVKSKTGLAFLVVLNGLGLFLLGPRME